MGYIFRKESMKAGPEKGRAVCELLVLGTQNELQGILAFGNFWCFIRDYSEIASPLTKIPSG